MWVAGIALVAVVRVNTRDTPERTGQAQDAQEREL